MQRKGSAVWQGDLRNGKGTVSTETGVVANAPYTFGTRFEDAPGTNPEELIAAAHAACFSMARASLLEKQGVPASCIHTVAKVHLGLSGAGPTLTRIELETEGEVPGLDQSGFEHYAETAKRSCLVSRALAAVPEIGLRASLVTEGAET